MYPWGYCADMVWTRKESGERRTRILHIRVSAKEAAAIEEFAAVARMSVSEYVREVATRPATFRPAFGSTVPRQEAP
jgi:hypothetical protein